ncbi:MAG: hypothetical protein MI751_11515 [Pseudomonadales bacterium]|uniref:hypothetical protein n=1 Tax=Alcanivorax profundi TaxID=2338368 RepID=UPI0032B1770C|nr:hypothetical protein [Pseudomonadales bacterium]|tara:strand:+ start:226 stop:552 length:327 start_codon:yes stop_codon:yes gene_type:complete
MKISKIERLMSFLACLTVFIAIVAGVLCLNITFSYPLKDVRIKVIKFKELNGRFPASLADLNNIDGVKFISVLKYENRGDDFLLYFCPTKLGPCEVCSKSREPHFDEI